MAAANGTASAFSLEVTGSNQTVADKVVSEGGDKLLAGLIRAAGLARGHWIFRAREVFTSRGDAPVLQVRQWDVYGVHIWVRAQGNVATKGVLHIPKDIGLKPGVVYDKLYAANGGTPGELIPRPGYKPKTAEITEILAGDADNGIDISDCVLLFMAIDELAKEMFKAPLRGDYVAELCSRLGQSWLPEAVDKQLTVCVRMGFLVDLGTHHAVTPGGRLRMEQPYAENAGYSADVVSGVDNMLAVARGAALKDKLMTNEKVETPLTPAPSPTPQASPVQSLKATATAPPPASAPPPPRTFPPATPATATPDTDLGALLAANESKLKRLIDLNGKLVASRKRQQELIAQISKLQLDVEKEKNVERQLAAGVDVEALMKLFGAVK